jgi:hypothetical protein
MRCTELAPHRACGGHWVIRFRGWWQRSDGGNDGIQFPGLFSFCNRSTTRVGVA